MSTPRTLDATVLIATYNRSRLLDETLSYLAKMPVRADLSWEVVVIDNNSADDTRATVERHQPHFPVSLRYLFERQQGRSSALNTGITQARGHVLAFTDDDVRVQDGWLDAACAPLRGPTPSADYTGGPVRPIWEVPPPQWLDLTRGDLWGTIAIQDHGQVTVRYEEARRVPLGANMAVRAAVFDVVGGFRADLGRTGGRRVLGQEVPEWLMRARRAGFGGLYVPAMVVHHHVPAGRLTPRYFRRWWFGKGVSRAALDRMQPTTELGIDLRKTPHILGVPRFMFGNLLRDAAGLIKEVAARRPQAAFRHQMMLAFFAGYFVARAGERFSSPAYRTSNVVTTGR
ncbi:MAG: glycosyltransferase family 2 protein [Acidobacteria bacterium]|nr:glycosyltransferase family 2 protein [Acidobacteriota bacterium]